MRLLDGPREIKQVGILHNQRTVDTLLQQPSLEFLDAVVDFSSRRGKAWVGHGGDILSQGLQAAYKWADRQSISKIRPGLMQSQVLRDLDAGAAVISPVGSMAACRHSRRLSLSSKRPQTKAP